MGKRSSKLGIIALIIVLSVGFATVTTNLIINGVANISTNPGDFNVYFSYANASDGSTAVIEDGNKVITFSGKKLTTKGEKAILNYTVKNDSSQYDANISLSVNVTDSSGIDHSEYYRITKEGFTDEEPTLLRATNEKNGSITIELVKAYADEEFSLTFEVILDVTAVERTVIGGYENITGTAYDDKGNILANKPMVMFSEPTYFMTDDEGHYEVTIPNGIHKAYYIPDVSMEELQEMGDSVKLDDRASRATVDTTIDTTLVFNLTKIGQIVTVGGEDFYYIGSTDDGYYKLLAKKPLDLNGVNGIVQSDNPTPISYCTYTLCGGYNDSLLKPYIETYTSSLHDDAFEVNGGTLLTREEFGWLSGLSSEVANNSESLDGDEHGGVFVDNIQRQWLLGNYWLYDTYNIVSYITEFYGYFTSPTNGTTTFIENESAYDKDVTRASVVMYTDVDVKNDGHYCTYISVRRDGYGYNYIYLRPVIYAKLKQN